MNFIKRIDWIFLKDYAITLFSFLIVGVVNILIYNSLPSHVTSGGSEVFAVYKKLSSLLLVALIGGMGVAVPKFILELDEKKSNAVLSFAFMVCLFLSGLAFCAFVLFPDYFGQLLIGKVFLLKDIFAIFSIILSGIINGCVFGYFRGNYNVKIANYIVITVSLVQFISVYLCSDIYTYIYLSSVLVIIVLLLFLLFNSNYFSEIFLKKLERKEMIQIFNYGIQRVPGDFSVDALTSIPVVITTSALGISYGGQMGFAMTVFGLIMTMMSPINFIMLPKISEALNLQKDIKKAKMITMQGAMIVFPMIIAVVLVIIFFAPFISEYVFHSQLPKQLNYYLRFVAISAIPYSFYSLIRGVLDAGFKKPVNSYNAMISLAFFWISLWIMGTTEQGILVSMAVSYSTLAILSVYMNVYLYKIKNK